jgi:copper chaperone
MQYHIQDMTCGGCARAVTATLKDLDENAVVSIDVEARLVNVESSSADDAIRQALAEAGFPAEVVA